MNRSQRDALVAAVRLVVVVVLLVVSLSWWLLQKAPDYRVDQRLRLEPANEVERTLGAVILDYEGREAWRIPAGKVARFRVVVPGDGAHVRFHEGFLQGLPALAVRMIRADGERVEIDTFDGSEAAWREHRLELPVEANEEVDIEFAALDGRGRPGLGVMLVADVVLESEGRPIDETENPVIARAVGVDLLADAALDKVRAPATFESAVAEMPGPTCLPLESGIARTLQVDQVPPGAELSIVLHVARLGAGEPTGSAQVLVSADELVLANVPVKHLAQPEGDMPPARELLVKADLFHWVGRSLSLQLELQGGNGLFVGVREVVVRQPQGRPRRPFDEETGLNTLLVIVDGLRPDRLGFNGYEPAHTPVIDGLARSGLRYENLVAPSSWALPNVATLLTGVHPLAHGLGLRPQRVLSPRIGTLAESASWAGFTTACFTSSAVISDQTGLDRGYETLFGGPVSPVSLVERAIDWLPEASQFEWFLTLHFDHPTAPHEPLKEDLVEVSQRADPDLVERLRALDSRPGAAEGVAMEVGPLADAEVAGVDRALGMFLDELERRGLRERTLVVVVGSHGQEFYEHLGRGQGQTLWDEVVRVPLVAAGPGVSRLSTPPIVEREMIQMTDVTQLVGQLGRVMTADHLPGRVPPPLGPSDSTQVAHSIVFPYQGVTLAELQASRREGVVLLTDRARDATQLLDLAPGPGQERDLLAPPAQTTWVEEARALEDAFADWYRTTILGSAARPVRWVR